MKTFQQLVALTLAGLMLALASLFWLGWHASQARQAELQAQLDSHLLRQLQGSAENYLATGLQLDQMQALQDIIEREQHAFASVIAIDVFSAAGTVLYSTDADSRGQPAPPEWQQQLNQTAPWTQHSSQQRILGQRFDNDLGQAAGGIAVTLSTATPRATLVQWRARAQHALQWLLLAALATLATVAGIGLGLKRLFAPYDAAARALVAGSPEPAAQSGALQQAAWHQQQRWGRELQRIQQGRDALEALDHES